MHIQTDHALLPAASPSVRYLHVTISAPSAPPPEATSRPPADIALVLDRSGSMGGAKIAMARAAVDHAVRLLQPHDHLTVVCYDDHVETVLPRTAATRDAKALALDRLAGIEARGATNLEGGWRRAASELRARPDPASAPSGPAGIARVLLLTDGLANRGVTDRAELVGFARQLREEGISTSTFGVGVDFDETLLADMARESGGHFYFVEHPAQIPDYLTSELGETLQVVARDVVFEVIVTPGSPTPVDLALLNALAPEQTPTRLRLRVGDLVADQDVTLVVAVAIDMPPAVGQSVSVQCRLRDKSRVFAPQPLAVEWTVASATANDQQPVNGAVMLEAAKLMAARARREALEANRHGDFARARGLLRDAAVSIRQMARYDAAVMVLADELSGEELHFAHALSSVELKRRHFRAHVVSASLESDGKARRRAKAS